MPEPTAAEKIVRDRVKDAFDKIAACNTITICSLDEMEQIVLRALSGEFDSDIAAARIQKGQEKMSKDDFYRRLDQRMIEERNARIFRDRPENLHDYQGCANDEKQRQEDFIAKDRTEAAWYADWLIEIVNADHHDVISFNRDIGCRIRDHIELLRRAAGYQPIQKGQSNG